MLNLVLSEAEGCFYSASILRLLRIDPDQEHVGMTGKLETDSLVIKAGLKGKTKSDVSLLRSPLADEAIFLFTPGFRIQIASPDPRSGEAMTS